MLISVIVTTFNRPKALNLVLQALDKQTDKNFEVIVADDGITNYKDAQYAIDNDLPMIVVNHAGCEIGGLKNRVNYFNDKLPDLDVEYLEEGFKISYFK